MDNLPTNISGKLRYLLLNRDNGHYLLFLCLVWSKSILVFARTFVVHNGALAFLAPIIDALILWALVPIAYKQLLGNIRAIDVFFYIVCIVIYLSQYMLYPENSEILSEYAPIFIFSTLPLIFIGVQLDINKTQDVFRYVSMLIILFCAFYSLYYSQRTHGIIDEGGDEMGMAYIVSPHVIYMLWQTLKEFKWTNLMITVFGCFILLSFGTRGPIVGIFVFLFTYFLFIGPLRKKISWIIIFLVLGGVFLYFSDQIILYLYHLMPKIGMSNRIFEKIIANEFAGYENSSSRDVILQDLWDGLQRHHYEGFGIGGTWLISGGYYAHNIYFDFIVSFGMTWGTILMAILLIFFARAYFSCHNDDEKAFFLILFTCGFFKLFISNLYLSEPYFWLLIGYSTYLIRHAHSKII